jgi:hypothetical protein
MFGGVAQLVRASACHAEGRRFEPGRPRHTKKEPPQKKAVFLLGFWLEAGKGKE